MFWTIVAAILFVSVVIPFTLWLLGMIFSADEGCGCVVMIIIVILVILLIISIS